MDNNSIFFLHFKYLIILLGAFYMNTGFSANNDFSYYKKPYFTIEFSAKRLGVDIRLNDIPVFNIDNTGFMTLEFPVNQYIINGNNEIKAITFPLFNDDDEQDNNYIDDSSIEISLFIREDGQETNTRKLLSHIQITPSFAYKEDKKNNTATFINNVTESEKNSLKVKINDNTLNYPLYGSFNKQVTTSWDIIDLKSSLPRWSWQDGSLITNDDISYKSLIDAYSQLHHAFIKNDLKKIKHISHERNNELAKAYYLENSDAGFEHSALGKHINHPTVKIHDTVYLDNTKFEIFGNGKLARIMNGADTHPIVFIDQETEQLYLPQFKWYRNSKNKWVLIR